MNEPITITIPDIRADSWNQYWAGRHWSKRRADAERMALLVRAAVDACTLYTVPVAITVTATYKRSPVDCSNVCAKPIEDALIGLLLVDDDPQHVVSFTAVSRKGTQDSIEITLTPVGGDE